MRDDDRYDPVDASDRFDIDSIERVNDQRAIRQQEQDALRLLDDGRTVAPMTVDDMRAEKSAAGKANAERFAHLEGSRQDWTFDDRWGTAS